MEQESEAAEKFISIKRKTIYISLFSCLILPLMLILFFGIYQGMQKIFFVLFLMASFSSLGIWFFVRLWEKKMQHSVNQIVRNKVRLILEKSYGHETDQDEPFDSNRLDGLDQTQLSYEKQIKLLRSSLAASKEEILRLNLEMDKKLEEMRLAYLEFEDLRQEHRRQAEEFIFIQNELKQNIENKNSLIAEYQKTISEQRGILEKKQNHIFKLETTLRDLRNEIHGLLQMEKIQSRSNHQFELSITDAQSSSKTPSDVAHDYSWKLQRYIEKAENLTGIDHLGCLNGKSPRFLDLSLEGYTVDRRRLLDSFSDEQSSALFIYNPVEKKFLFVNSFIKTLTGLSPEKFMKILLNGQHSDWMERVSKLRILKPTSLCITVSNPTGGQQLLDCYMGVVNKGPFANHMIGLFAALHP